jgi:hypothetical protein
MTDPLCVILLSRYRLAVGELEKDRQVVQLYLTPLSGKSLKEFLAFEYVYTRQR